MHDERMMHHYPFIPPNPNMRISTGDVRTLEDSYAPVPFRSDDAYNVTGRFDGRCHTEPYMYHHPTHRNSYPYNSHMEVRGPEDLRHLHLPIQRDESSPIINRNHRGYVENLTENHNMPPVDKRKAREENPQLISNQSSDDSLDLLRNNKKSKTSDDQSGTQMKNNFNALPRLESMLSRDDQLDSLARSMINNKGSAEGINLFKSWSFSGGVEADGYSFDDVPTNQKEYNPAWDDKMSSAHSEEQNNTQPMASNPSLLDQQQFSYTYNNSTHTLDHQRPMPPYGANNWSAVSNYYQPLHPEQRVVPFSDQLYRYAANSSVGSGGFYHGVPYGHNDYYQYEMPPHNYYNHFPRRVDSDPSHSSHDLSDGKNNPSSNMSYETGPQTPQAANRWNSDLVDRPPNQYANHGPTKNPNHHVWNRSDTSPQLPQRSFPFDRVESDNENALPDRMTAVSVEFGSDGMVKGMRNRDGILLLSLPDDTISLSETLCIVRENIEVFVATEADVKAPAPGRKRPVVIGQVGLRCIHCRQASRLADKVKRAVCFPSSMKRIYRTVIDMKLDHFKACQYVPIDLKSKLEELKVGSSRSTGTTMQYFVQAAQRMGMVDGMHGIKISAKNTLNQNDEHEMHSAIGPNQSIHRLKDTSLSDDSHPFSLSKDASSGAETSSNSFGGSSVEISVQDNIQYYDGKVPLSIPSDKSTLSPLRCFLRENTVAFSATAEDIAVRTPTTFSVQLGQVGIGCKYCHHLPAKVRSNRAVCFPFSIGRIYQSVADIQRFHFGECTMIPSKIKYRFLELQEASSKGSKGLATRQYWISAAKEIGLTDTSNGIRFYRDPATQIEKTSSLDMLATVASESDTSVQLVLEEDKPQIAEFIFEVMKQLQPCKFTEADRNKRRLKDVGCVGVECKHCAGQADGRKFFWSSVSAVESNFVSVHTHMFECKMVPQELKEKLVLLKSLRKEQTSLLKNGSQKAFFSRVWNRLHQDDHLIPSPTKSERDRDSQCTTPFAHVNIMNQSQSFYSASYSSPIQSFASFASPLSNDIPSPPVQDRYRNSASLDSVLFLPQFDEKDTSAKVTQL